MWVVIKMGGGYSGSPEYVDMIYGPFTSEEESEEWVKTHSGCCGWYAKEVYPAT